MKSTFAFVLTVSVLLCSMSKTILFFHYEINKSYYATELCENKGNPGMHCNGKCQLHKELKEQEKKENNPVSPVKEKQEITFFLGCDLQGFLNFIFNNSELSQFYLFSSTNEILFPVFRPPTV